jgi:hypothetical protein
MNFFSRYFDIMKGNYKVMKALESMTPAIERIDAGCPYCVRRFVEYANECLKEAHIPYQYVVTDELNDQGDFVVKVIKDY